MVDGSSVVIGLMAAGIVFMIISGYSIGKGNKLLSRRNYEMRRQEICGRRAMRQRSGRQAQNPVPGNAETTGATAT
jgi:hypothetical protein